VRAADGLILAAVLAGAALALFAICAYLIPVPS
jgi:hypothetical protein